MVVLWMVLMGCAPGEVTLSVDEVTIEFPQYSDVYYGSEVTAFNSGRQEVQLSTALGWKPGDGALHTIGSSFAVIPADGEAVIPVGGYSADSSPEVGETYSYELLIDVLPCDGECPVDDLSGEESVDTLTLTVFAEVVDPL